MDRPLEFCPVYPLFFRHHQVHGQEDNGRGVDRHGGAHFVQGNAGKQGFHVGQGIDGHSYFTHFSFGQGMIGIQADLGEQVKSYAQARLPLRKQVLVASVGFCGAGKAGVLAHSPEPTPVHVALHPPGKGIFSREGQVFFFRQVQGSVDSAQGYAGAVAKTWPPFGKTPFCLI